ncbi:hypothetical protein [Deinococcus frigens]|uniref:hypothetical protein n=1 Tax=Deinococcus frigens TaxID=249403 RepID=UPI00068A94BD|nr:hypothetical protein [Deinococcus frigens]
MTWRAVQVDRDEISPVFARLYGSDEQDFAMVLFQLTATWLVQDGGGQIAGAIGLRLSPTYRVEIMGGAFPGPDQNETALTLLLAALATQPHVYAYAKSHLLPAEVLEAAGLHRIGAYTRMIGPVSPLVPAVPNGFRAVPLSEVRSPQDRLAAQRTYSYGFRLNSLQ